MTELSLSHYNRFRYYDPEIGRYISADPVGQSGLLLWNLSGLGQMLSDSLAVPLLSGEPVNLYQYARLHPIRMIDILGLQTTVIVTRDSFLGVVSYGSHAAVHVSNGGDSQPFLYDPGGSFRPGGNRGSGDFFSGAQADLDAYIAYQQSTGSTVDTYVFNTTDADEAMIADRAMQIGGTPGLLCAVSASGALNGVPLFSGVGALTPGGLGSQLQSIQAGQ